MIWFRRLFGGRGEGAASAAASAHAVEYHGFTILPQPRRQGGQFLTAGMIVKDTPTGRREHRFVRADTLASEEEARDFTIRKAQRLIDEVGDRLFEEG